MAAFAATSLELADATLRAFQNRGRQTPHIVGLDRHGVVAIGRDPWDASRGRQAARRQANPRRFSDCGVVTGCIPAELQDAVGATKPS